MEAAAWPSPHMWSAWWKPWEIPNKESHSNTLLWGSLLDMVRYRNKITSGMGCCRAGKQRILMRQKFNYVLEAP